MWRESAGERGEMSVERIGGRRGEPEGRSSRGRVESGETRGGERREQARVGDWYSGNRREELKHMREFFSSSSAGNHSCSVRLTPCSRRKRRR